MASTYDNWKLQAPEDERRSDEDEIRCTECGAWFDSHEVDANGRCPRCQSSIATGGTPGCAGGAR